MVRKLFCLLMLYITSCEPSDNKLKIKNQIGKDIYYIITYNNLNTEIDAGNPIHNDEQFVKAGEMGQATAFKKDWRYIFEQTERINIFIFEAKTIQNEQWEKVAAQKKILRHYLLSLNDLEQASWILVIK